MKRVRVPTLVILCAFLLGGVYVAQEQMKGQEQQPQQQAPPQPKPAPSPSSPDGIEGFGQVGWGMKPDEVASYLPSGTRGDSGGIRVNMNVGGMPSETYFVFKDDALAIISGRFTQRYNRLNDYVNEYNSVKNMMSRTLGAPVLEEEVWADDGLPQDEKELGRAVATGRLRLGAWWETDKSYVELLCRGGNYQVSRTVRFQSVEYGGSGRKPRPMVEKTNNGD